MRLRLPALIGAALLVCGTPAIAAPGDDIGATVRVVNLVTGAYAKDKRHLAKGDSVRQDELIEVSADGIGEIKLRDDTKLALGPGARLLLDEFVYNPDISGGAIVVNLVKGAFRFITGIAARPAYVIRTPTASVTVRGTIFDVYVQESGLSWLLLIDGAVEVCNAQAQCGTLDEPGKLIRITPDGVIGTPVAWADLDKDGIAFDTAFPFVVRPPEIDPDPIFTPDDIVSGGGTEPPDDNRGGRDDTGDEPDVDGGVGPEPPYPQPPLTCWNGWKEVPKGWHAKGWQVKKKRRGARVIYCAHPLPPDDAGDKPVCDGGKLVGPKVLPPKWACLCPKGTKRIKTGPNAYVCKGTPGGGDAKKDCLKKGGIWTGTKCILVGKCPPGFIGKPPFCTKIVKPKPCPPGFSGTWPNCKKLVLKPLFKN